MLGILLGMDDGLLHLIPGTDPERGIQGPRITAVDYRDGLGIAADDAGVWVHAGKRWEQCWEGQPSSVRVAPDGRLFVGTAPAGLFVSEDRGATWNEWAGLRNVTKHNNFPSPPGHKAPYTAGVAFPKEGVLIGIAGGGCWHTRDEGASWLRRSDGLDAQLHALGEHPEQRDRVFATSASGFYRSDDGGFSWVQSLGGLDRSWGGTFAIVPGTPDSMIFAVARHAPGQDGALFRSPNGGVTWARIMLDEDDEWERIPVVTRLWDSEDTLFAAAGDKVWGSHDGGRNWMPLAEGLPVASAIAGAL